MVIQFTPEIVCHKLSNPFVEVIAKETGQRTHSCNYHKSYCCNGSKFKHVFKGKKKIHPSKPFRQRAMTNHIIYDNLKWPWRSETDYRLRQHRNENNYYPFSIGAGK